MSFSKAKREGREKVMNEKKLDETGFKSSKKKATCEM